jgi:hypothetical protein
MLLLLLLWTLPAAVQAQYTNGLVYTINGGTITITGYTGPSGSVSIPDRIPDSPYGLPVTSIGLDAFYDCYWLTNVTIGNMVASIGVQAFEGTGLTSVTIGTNVTSIGVEAFYWCPSLTAITIDARNPAFSSVGGVLFNKNQTMLIQCPGALAGAYTIPNSVTSIGDGAFGDCSSLTSITIPNSVINIGSGTFIYCSSLSSITIGSSVASIGYEAFLRCSSLTTITIPNSVTSIGDVAFSQCTSLTNATIGSSVTSIGDCAFCDCPSLTGVYFDGDAPRLGGSSVFTAANRATVYYLPGATGWGATFGGRPTALWIQVPTIQTPPQTQTAEAGSAVGLWARASSPLPLFYLWYLNSTNLTSCSTNRELSLTNVQLAQSGAYTVVISNVLGAVTSPPAMLNVIAAVERRPVPGVKVTGQIASLLNVDYADSLSRAPNWTTLGSVSLTSTSQYYFDLTLPLPPQRFYRAWQTGTPSVRPSGDLHMVPAITLTGSIGASVRLDYINQFGPTDAWATLDTVTLTNASQLYFDVSCIGQPQRLYRLVPLP